MSISDKPSPVALFVTCLVDLMRPSVGFASASLIEKSGFDVVVPDNQTCCGQPNYNNGDRSGALGAARHTISLLEPYKKIVVPSGSCAAMMIKHYPDLMQDDPAWLAKARDLADRVYELTQFLDQFGETLAMTGVAPVAVTYQDSCSGLRELGIAREPRALLDNVTGITLNEMDNPDTCCGFGGTFCVKYPEISDRMVERKAADIEQTGADIVLAGDTGCLMQMEGKLHRAGSTIRVRHIAEILASIEPSNEPPIESGP